MERLGYNPYTLPITYNYRGSGDVILGKVRIWHSHYKRPGNVNKKPDRWPPRRAYHSTLIYFDLHRIRYCPRFLLQRIRPAVRRKSLSLIRDAAGSALLETVSSPGHGSVRKSRLPPLP